MAKILIVEDDVDLCSRVQQWLSFQQHTVDAVHDGKEGLDRLKHYDYELVILDWELPNLNGPEICRSYRLSGGKAPVLMLTGKSDLSNKLEGLDAGSDDYLTKPFHMEELSARLRALMRRGVALSGAVLQVQYLALDTVKQSLTCNGKEVTLAPKEYQLIEFLMRHPDEIFSQEALLEKVWSSESEASIFSVYTAIKTLRKKITVEG
ncbi:MAG: response regulator transcription factor, partial [Candidatus Obscuribacterales bacterium]|nr:response regulator transcription factor [Candidatus Obscuribacterales bacterium]